MNEEQFSDFVIAFGQCCMDSISPVVGWQNIVPQDAYEVFLRVFEQPPSPNLLASLSERQKEDLREGFERYFECKAINMVNVREAIDRTLARWPASPQ